MIIEMIFIWYFAGLLYGALETALGKYGLFLLPTMVVLSLISLSTGGTMNLQIAYEFSNWWYFALFPAMLGVMKTGVSLIKFYKEIK